MALFFVGDFGLDITLTVVDANGDPVNLSASTVREFEIEDPKRNITTVSATFVTDGTDGKLTYTLASGDLDENGKWNVRARITEGATRLFRTEKIGFTVES